MIIYSCMPLELVLDGIEQLRDDLHEINFNGMTVQVELLNSHQARIVRLISPNPQHYLNASLAPGQIIQFQPVG